MKNTGKWLEEEIKRIADDYQRRGILSLAKADPPIAIKRIGPKIVPIQLENPFLDFLGAWKRRGGRAIFLEAKSTQEEKLKLGDGGLTDNQWAALRRWRAAGAAVGVLWGMTRTCEIRFVPFELIESQLRNDAKHVKWQHAEPLQPGLGFCTWNFEQALADYHPEAPQLPGEPMRFLSGPERLERQEKTGQPAWE